MRPIATLLDRGNTLERGVLTEELAILYGGDLRFLEHEDRPYVVGNFVSTVDGPRWPPQNRPYVATSKPANGPRPGHELVVPFRNQFEQVFSTSSQ
jgi:hypothetical protein